MVTKVSLVLFLAASACLANPMPQGEAGAEVKRTEGGADTLNLFGTQKFQTNDQKGVLDLSANHLRELGGQNRHQTNAAASGAYDFLSGDRGKATVFGGHQRTWNSNAPDTHNSHAGVAGSYDVFKSDDGRTRGTVFGSHQQNWFSNGQQSRATEYGGKVTHTWGRR